MSAGENTEPQKGLQNGDENATASSGTGDSAEQKLKIQDQDHQTPASELAAVENLKKTMELLRMNLAASAGPAKNLAQAAGKKYEFWSTQPVPKIDEDITTNEAIDNTITKEQIRKEPYSLPEQFIWCTVDLEDDAQLKELYQLLNENYVEDDDNMFRFDYAPEFLKWALMPPGWLPQWHVGVRVAKSGKLVGFISAVPAHVRVYDKPVRMSEVNFLCVHKKMRSKRVAPVLIREITRRCNIEGIFQAAYTAGVVLPKPVGVCRYWHRSLNPRKLIEVKFSHLTRNMTMQRTLKLHKLPEQPKIAGFRAFNPTSDGKQAFSLLSNYLKKFQLAPQFTLEEFLHWFTPRDGVVESYVVADRSDKVKDFVSFYSLPSSIMHHPFHKTLQAAYTFYAVANSVTLCELMYDALVVAKNRGYDVFNALDLMDNKEFLEELKFGIGDGNLQYYLYNWRCPALEPEKIGLVLQ
ncbi:glycylpeptide N-tetradecanoyltransferase 2-like [Varroa jacobsoni]|uniref:Glycylpeptide N-tetradecanoyltransferase n=2 Tax=Varroa destructor TaxID=109461 RepID=A0A7M7JB33_VARDE|nr:glycylpeptide N-tetradecanoyltransferase 2-like isoform X1 [Varroa destructor]XP_022649436.1 glycylpeptide N-tetradecanoyltransferase 2-like isoform X1 [Varroa destructor]XP_022649437.1 glycylpeptide N-tetradecanoyltransferase 2-like isoform X1 [Varroa destructor]XP_022649438.1 glycylpeptide N-tetradecanoyltransferase 2-like isoform X1 [Varroa destructor]XP_022695043.1 glycylpeptide N-tetradecanoyltransferase 2-like [Varroa jacobsoni]XP_022695044.1 glycylpeptide N-tetradecanoyltransferase 2